MSVANAGVPDEFNTIQQNNLRIMQKFLSAPILTKDTDGQIIQAGVQTAVNIGIPYGSGLAMISLSLSVNSASNPVAYIQVCTENGVSIDPAYNQFIYATNYAASPLAWTCTATVPFKNTTQTPQPIWITPTIVGGTAVEIDSLVISFLNFGILTPNP